MRTYRVPILINEEPKIFGGKATLKQVGYVLAGLMLAYIAYQAVRPLSRDAAMTAAGAAVLLSAAVAFVRVPRYDMGLDAYVVRWLLYTLRPKRLPYKRTTGGEV